LICPPLAHAHTERASVDSPKLDEKNDKAKTGGGGQGGTVRVVALPLFQTERERKNLPNETSTTPTGKIRPSVEDKSSSRRA